MAATLWRHRLAAVVVVLAAWASYSGNLLQVAEPRWFERFSLRSEHLVFDTLWLAEQGQPWRFGTFLPADGLTALDADALAAAVDATTPFEPYVSQFGLHVRVYAALLPLIGLDYGRLTLLTSLAAALALGWLWLRLQTAFGALPAWLVTLTLLLSPWPTVFAQRLYWAPLSWLLPLVATTLTVRGAVQSRRGLLLLAAAVWLAVTLRMLSGYEFISTVVITGSLPLFFALGRAGVSLRGSLPLLTTYAAAVLLAALTAFTLHAVDLQQRGYDGWAVVTMTAGKYAAEEQQRAEPERTCAALVRQGEDCTVIMSQYEQAARASGAAVTLAYLRPPYALPWSWLLAREAMPVSLQGWRQASTWPLGAEGQTPAQAAAAVVRISVLPLLGLATLWSLRGTPRWWWLMQALGWAAPISWYVLMSSHSLLHTRFNFVLWYLPTVPLALLSIGLALSGWWQRPAPQVRQ